MANLRVNLFKRVKVHGGLKYCPVVYTNNGRIKQDMVRVGDNEERHPEGAYYISWYVGTKVMRAAVGRDASDAVLRQQEKEAELANGKPNGNGSGNANGADTENGNGNGTSATLSEAIKTYLSEVKGTKKPKTYAAYSKALEYFTKSAGADTPVSQINRTHLMEFRAFLAGEGLSARSTFNKFQSVVTFLGNQGATMFRLNKKGRMTVAGISPEDWPNFTVKVPEVYEEDEINLLFAACTREERLWFQFFLMTGMREQEVMYTYWNDLNLQHATIKVTAKPDRNWTPKAYKEREIPIPQTLVDTLRAHKASREDRKCNLIFPTAGCNPKLDFLDCLKRVADRAGLTCHIKLHKFRATFATWHLWKGVDIRTVQEWMGHSDLEATMRYLRPNRTTMRSKVNDTFGGIQ